tara:strand:- start:130 stop:618 length:489 start_codon:yes stop_codon:yes gene_type:complete
MIYLIATVSDNNIIGVEGLLPWAFKKNLQWFRMHTFNSAIIMGRKTWESLSDTPLSDRINIVLTRGPCPEDQPSVIWRNSMTNAMNFANERSKNIYIVGGGEIFHLSFAYKIDGIIMTKVHKTVCTDKKTTEIVLPINKQLIWRSKEQEEEDIYYHFELLKL